MERTYKSDVDVDGAIVQKPMHECSFWGHHVWISLPFLGGLFCRCETRTGILRWLFWQFSGVGGRVEFRRLVQHWYLGCRPWFC